MGVRRMQMRLVRLHGRIAKQQLKLRLLRAVHFELQLQIESRRLAEQVIDYANQLGVESGTQSK